DAPALELPADFLEAVDEDLLARVGVDERDDGEITGAAPIDAADVAGVRLRRALLGDGADLGDAAKDAARVLDELGQIFLPKQALRQRPAGLIDLARRQLGVGVGREIPAFVFWEQRVVPPIE